MTTETDTLEGYDLPALNHELDRVKSKVFLGRNAAFLGPLMSSLDFSWTTMMPTAATDGESFWWHPADFLKCTPEERAATVEHELWHVARLHMFRVDTRDMKIWNIACDIRINRDLRKEGYVLNPPMWIPDYPEIAAEAEEDIYDYLIANKVQPPPGGAPDHFKPGSRPGSQQAAIANVVKSLHQSKIAGKPGALSGEIEKIVSTFLAPVVPWQTVLNRFFSDLLEEEYTWRRPNRRFQSIYLPTRFMDEGRLEHLAYYWDVSGSISDADEIRFNSEVKFIKDQYQPHKLTLSQFDTRITSEQVFLEADPFDGVKIVGKGGTCLAPVRQHIIDNKPTAAIIFSDMYCAPMEPLPPEADIPVIWIVVNNKGAQVPFGQIIHIKG